MQYLLDVPPPRCFSLFNFLCILYWYKVFALLGHNGAGKSTAIKMCAGTLPPTVKLQQKQTKFKITHLYWFILIYFICNGVKKNSFKQGRRCWLLWIEALSIKRKDSSIPGSLSTTRCLIWRFNCSRAFRALWTLKSKEKLIIKIVMKIVEW